MSAGDYTLFIKVQGLDDILKKLQNLSAASPGSPSIPPRVTGAASPKDKEPNKGRSIVDLISGKGSVFGNLDKLFNNQTSVFKKLDDIGAGQLIKLAGIGLGIGALLDVTIKSSNILQGTLKIFQQAITLIFKPMGDMFGLLLRPLAMGFLLWALPFYQKAYKWINDQLSGKENGPLNPGMNGGFLQNQTDKVSKAINDFGDWAGGELRKVWTDFTTKLETAGSLYVGMLSMAWNNFVDFLTKGLSQLPTTFYNIFDTVGKQLGVIFKYIPDEVYKVFSDLWTKLSSFFGGIPGDIVKVFTDLKNGFTSLFGEIPGDIFKTFSDLANGLIGFFGQIPGDINKVFTDLGANLTTAFTTIPGMIGGVFSGLADSITKALATIPSQIYNAIMSWLKSLVGGAPGSQAGPGAGMNSTATSGNSAGQSSRNTMALMATAVTN